MSTDDIAAERTERPRRAPSALWLAAAGGTAISAAALVVMAIVALAGIGTGAASDSTRAVTEAVMLLVLAFGVGVVVVGLVRRKRLAKTPTLLWNGMLVPIGLALFEGGAKAMGVGTIVVAVLTFGAALLLPRYDIENDPADDADTVL